MTKKDVMVERQRPEGGGSRSLRTPQAQRPGAASPAREPALALPEHAITNGIVDSVTASTKWETNESANVSSHFLALCPMISVSEIG
jgi:hypothetical protein